MAASSKRLSVSLRGTTLTIRNEFFRVNYELESGTWNYMDRSGFTIIKNAYAAASLDRETILRTLDEGKRWFITEEHEDELGGTGQRITFFHQKEPGAPILKLHFRGYDAQPYVLLQAAVENVQNVPLIVKQLYLIDTTAIENRPRGGVYLGSEPTQYHLFLDSCSTYPRGMQSLYDGFDTDEISAYESRADGLLYDKLTQRSLVFGFLSHQKWWSTIHVAYSSQLQAQRGQRGVNIWSMEHTCDVLCAPGGEIVSEPAYLNFAAPASEAQATYARLTSLQMDTQPLERTFVSWTPGYLGPESVSEQTFVDQLAWLAEHRSQVTSPKGGLEYIQVPHGWQAQPGSIETVQDRFPHGMRWLADKIHESGFKAGIHLVPCYVSLSSPLADQCRAFLIYDKDSKVIQVEVPEQNEPVALLDPSHPGAQSYLRRMLQKVIHDWGYDLIMVDMIGYIQGLRAENIVPRFHQSGLTLVEIYRLALRTMLQTIQEDDRSALLLSHYGPCAAAWDMLPVSPLALASTAEESPPAWEDRLGIRQRIKAWAARQYLNGVIARNDMGILRIAAPRPLNEVLVGLTAAAMSGGVFTFGDEWSSLDAERLEAALRILPLMGKPCRILDVYDRELPEVWLLELDDLYLLALFNWGDYQEDRSLGLEQLGLDPRKSYLVQDFWSGEFVGSFQKSLDLLRVPAHSVKLLGIREEQEVPQFLSLDLNIGQGMHEMISVGWDPRSQSLLGICELGEGQETTLSIYVPPTYLPATVSGYGAHYRYEWKRPIFQIRLSRSRGLTQFCVHFVPSSG